MELIRIQESIKADMAKVKTEVKGELSSALRLVGDVQHELRSHEKTMTK